VGLPSTNAFCSLGHTLPILSRVNATSANIHQCCGFGGGALLTRSITTKFRTISHSPLQRLGERVSHENVAGIA